LLPNKDKARESDDKTIKYGILRKYNEKFNLNGHSNLVLSLAVLKNNDLAYGSADNSIKIWNIN